MSASMEWHSNARCMTRWCRPSRISPASSIKRPRRISTLCRQISNCLPQIQLINEVAREQSSRACCAPSSTVTTSSSLTRQPSPDLTVNALTAAHGVMIPLEAEYFAMRGVALLVDQIERVQDRLNPRLRIDGVLRRWSTGAQSMPAKSFPQSVSNSATPCSTPIRARCASQMPRLRQSHHHVRPEVEGAESYRRLARELIFRGGSP